MPVPRRAMLASSGASLVGLCPASGVWPRPASVGVDAITSTKAAVTLAIIVFFIVIIHGFIGDLVVNSLGYPCEAKNALSIKHICGYDKFSI